MTATGLEPTTTYFGKCLIRRLRTKWLWVRVQLQSLKFQISLLWIHSETRTWHDNIQSKAIKFRIFLKLTVFIRIILNRISTNWTINFLSTLTVPWYWFRSTNMTMEKKWNISWKSIKSTTDDNMLK